MLENFNRDVSAATRAADQGPVVITDRGEPAYVVLSMQEYREQQGSGESLVDRLSMEDDLDIDFDPVEMGVPLVNPWYHDAASGSSLT